MPKLLSVSRLFKRVTLIQKFTLVAVLFWIALLPLIFFVIYTYLGVYSIINREIQGMLYEKPIQTLFELIPQHQNLIRTLKEDQTQEQQEKLNKLNQRIENLLHEIVNLYEEHRLTVFKKDLTAFSSPYHLLPQKLEHHWLSFQQDPTHLDPYQNSKSYHQLMQDLITFSVSVGDSYNLINGYESELASLYLAQAILSDIPQSQFLLFQLSQQIDHLQPHTPLMQSDQNRWLTLIQLLKIQTDRIREEIEKGTYYGKVNHSFSSPDLPAYFTHYQILILQVIEQINKSIQESSTIQINSDEIQALIDQSLSSGFTLWEFSQHILERILFHLEKLLREQFWLSFILSLAIAILAFSLGFLLTLRSVNRLEDLTRATNSFTSGNLSVQVAITYHDEIGRLGVAFNRMAQRLREMISQLYQLLEGTKHLASGDLSIRIHTPNPNSDFGQVAQSFNNMAQTFEDLINRFKKLGISLTSSATEISMTSKEQENIISEQGATTHEIALSASEISNRAKEFANTINEVTIVAEKTSDLASDGKASLSNMEQVMRQMVEGSTNIAAKLAVLNEKAGNITTIMTTINKVADQTNLLSLNASIEAEKAGEYGRSFAVIAREIRRLADQTALATFDIEKTVDEIMMAISSSVMGVDDFTREIRNGVNQVNKVSEHLGAIIEQVQLFTARFESVNEGMQAQSTGAEQITAAINQLSQTAQQTSEAIHQFHLTIEELNHSANELNQLMPQFKTSRKS
jgi:methyl-accepting chemotaxis protein WspA